MSEMDHTSQGPQYPTQGKDGKTRDRKRISGELYEIKICAFLLLKGILCTDEFYLATNYESAKGFDDVVFKYRIGDKFKTIFIQLKHFMKEKEKNIVTLDKKVKQKFDVGKCYKDYNNIVQLLSSNNEKVFLQNNPQDCEYVFYTNGGIDPTLIGNICTCPNILSTKNSGNQTECICNGGPLPKIVGDVEHGIFSFVENSTSYEAIKHKFPAEGRDEFLKLFKMYVCQASEKDLDDIIKYEIKKGFNTTQKVADQTGEELILKITEWWKEDEFTYLTKNVNFMDDIIKLHKQQIYKLIENKIEELNELHISFKKGQFHKLKKSIDDCHVLNIVSDSESNTSLATLKVQQCLQEMGYINFILLDIKRLIEKRDEVLTLWPSAWCPILVLECDSTYKNINNLCSDLASNLNQNNNSSKLIIISTSDKFRKEVKRKYHIRINDFEDHFQINDLDTNSKKLILEKDIIFQGKNASLSILISNTDSNIPITLSTDAVISILRGETVTIGRCLPPKIPIFISRVLMRNIKIKPNILRDEKQKVKFIFSETDLKSLMPLLEPCEKVYNIKSPWHQDKETGQYNIFESHEDAECFLNFQNPNDNIQWYSIEKKSQMLIWIGSKGDLNIIKEYIDNTVSTDESNVLEIMDRIVPIVSEPGSGKSIFLQHSAHEIKEAHPSAWIIYINVNNYINVSHEMCNMLELKQYIFSQKKGNVIYELEETLFDYALNTTGNVVVMIDDVDAAIPSQKEEALTLLRMFCKYKFQRIWITSRPVMQKCIESEFCSLCYSLKPLTEADQQSFLIKYWENEKKPVGELKNFAKLLIKRTNALSTESKKFTAIPLHILMLAELFKSQDIPTELDLLHLYKGFVKKKFQVFCDERLVLTRKNPALSHLLDVTSELFTTKHCIPALYSLLSENNFKQLEIQEAKRIMKQSESEFQNNWYSTGIIAEYVDNKPYFTHRMFAEYFAALWFSENFEGREDILRKLLFQQGLENIRNIFDRIFASQHQFHLDTLNNDYDNWNQNCQNQNMAKDNGCRIPLHLAASYNRDDIAQILLKDSAEEQVITRDNILKLNPYEYGILSNSFKVNEKILEEVKTVESKISLPKESIQDVLTGGYVNIIENQPQMIEDVVDYHDDYGASALHVAAKGCHKNLAHLLINKGKKLVESRDQGGNIPLHSAAFSGDSSVVDLLIENKSPINACNTDGNTATHIATMKNHEPVIRILIAQGADTNIRNNNGNTPLHCAIWIGKEELVEILIKEGNADVTLHNNEGNSCIDLAVNNNKLEVAPSLLKINPVILPVPIIDVKIFFTPGSEDINMPDGRGFTPLHKAIKSGHSEAVKYIIREGSFINPQNISGNTPLHWSAGRGQVKLTNELINAGADLNIQNLNGNTPLHRAVKQNSVKTIHCLVSQGADMNIRNKSGYTPLFWALRYSKTDSLKYFIQNNIGLNSCDTKGNNPLHWSIKLNLTDITKLLIEKNVDVKCGNLKNNTPLHVAIKYGHLDSVKLLLEFGNAEIECPNSDGHTPVLWAIHYKQMKILSYLVDKGASLDAVDNKLNGALHTAVDVGDKCIVCYLLEHGAKMNTVNIDGSTPFDITQSGEIIQILKYFKKQIIRECGSRPDSNSGLSNKIKLPPSTDNTKDPEEDSTTSDHLTCIELPNMGTIEDSQV